MFQYAFYLSLSNRGFITYADLSDFKFYHKHNGFELQRIFNINVRQAPPMIIKLLDRSKRNVFYRAIRRIMQTRKAFYEEAIPFNFDKNVYNSRNNLFSGYWQNCTYFETISKQLFYDFRFSEPVDPQNRKYLQKINATVSVAVHVRRGDYLLDPLLGGLCPESYYIEAMSMMKQLHTGCHFFIFSNDMEWCRERLQTENSTFVTGNVGIQSFRDMQLMIACRHIIIANSSFSWWSAYLNDNPDKTVICPQKWTTDNDLNTDGLLPLHWIKI